MSKRTDRFPDHSCVLDNIAFPAKNSKHWNLSCGGCQARGSKGEVNYSQDKGLESILHFKMFWKLKSPHCQDWAL